MPCYVLNMGTSGAGDHDPSLFESRGPNCIHDLYTCLTCSCSMYHLESLFPPTPLTSVSVPTPPVSVVLYLECKSVCYHLYTVRIVHKLSLGQFL